MTKYYVTMLTSSNRKEFQKEFSTKDSFLKWVESRLDTNVKRVDYYSVSLANDNVWQRSSIESIMNFGFKKTLKDKKSNSLKNESQRNSRNPNLIVKGNKIVSLSMTKARVNKYDKWLQTAPLTSKERSIVISLLIKKTLTEGQWELLNDIEARANRRKPISS